MKLVNPVLKDFWLTPSRFKFLYGGRGSSKSYDFATILAVMADLLKLKVVVARQFQSSIKDSCKSLIEQRIETIGSDRHYDLQRTTTINLMTGSEFLYYGIARNIHEIKSLDNVDILVIEEGAKLTKEQWATLEPTIRKEGSQIWVIWNPDLATDFMWSLVLNPPADSLIRCINFDENEFLSETMRKSIADAKRRLPPEEFAHIYLGVPRTDDQLSFIKPSWLRACIDAHIKLDRPGIAYGDRRLGLDLADGGKDSSAVALATGNLLCHAEEWKSSEDQLLASVQIGFGKALEFDAILIPDVIGIGASAIPKVMEMNELRHREGLPMVEYAKFHAGERPSDSIYIEDILCQDHFTNKKSEAWQKTSDRARNTFVLVSAIEAGLEDLPQFADDELLSLSSELECLNKLITELSSPRKVIDLAGKTMVEKKMDMAKRGIASPNLADAAIIALYRKQESVSFFDDF